MNKISYCLKYIKDINLKIFITKSLRKIFYKKDSKLAWKINEYNEQSIKNYLDKELKKTDLKIEDEIKFRNSNVPKSPIWIMWWQGEEVAPEIVKCCINSIRKNCNGHEIIIITESNISNYVKLPEFIYSKLEKDSITKTHLSDIIRLSLLYLYGGLWIDSTVFVSQPIPEDLFQKKFFSINFGIKTKDPSHGRWTTFLMFSKKNNKLVKLTLEYHLKYWCNHDIIIDYVFFDHIINYIIEQNDDCYKMIRDIPKNNPEVFSLFKILNKSDINWNINKLSKDTIFYKLSYKHELIKEKDGIKTIYGKIVDDFL